MRPHQSCLIDGCFVLLIVYKRILFLKEYKGKPSKGFEEIYIVDGISIERG